LGLIVIPETDKLLLDFHIIQEGKLLFANGNPLIDTRVFIERIIVTQVILIDDLVYQLASFAAEYFLFRTNSIVQAVFATMVALDLLIRDGWHTVLK